MNNWKPPSESATDDEFQLFWAVKHVALILSRFLVLVLLLWFDSSSLICVRYDRPVHFGANIIGNYVKDHFKSKSLSSVHLSLSI